MMVAGLATAMRFPLPCSVPILGRCRRLRRERSPRNRTRARGRGLHRRRTRSSRRNEQIASHFETLSLVSDPVGSPQNQWITTGRNERTTREIRVNGDGPARIERAKVERQACGNRYVPTRQQNRRDFHVPLFSLAVIDQCKGRQEGRR